MEIFKPLPVEGYEWINACDEASYEVFRSLDGSPVASSWEPVRVRRVRTDERHEFRPSDFPWLGSHALVMRGAALEALRELLLANGEVLPLATEDGIELFAFNARKVDALDETLSTLVRFPGSERIMRIVKPVFDPSALRGVDLFRVPHRASPIYVSDHFVRSVKEAKLRGLDFRCVWK